MGHHFDKLLTKHRLSNIQINQNLNKIITNNLHISSFYVRPGFIIDFLFVDKEFKTNIMQSIISSVLLQLIRWNLSHYLTFTCEMK